MLVSKDIVRIWLFLVLEILRISFDAALRRIKWSLSVDCRGMALLENFVQTGLYRNERSLRYRKFSWKGTRKVVIKQRGG